MGEITDTHNTSLLPRTFNFRIGQTRWTTVIWSGSSVAKTRAPGLRLYSALTRKIHRAHRGDGPHEGIDQRRDGGRSEQRQDHPADRGKASGAQYERAFVKAPANLAHRGCSPLRAIVINSGGDLTSAFFRHLLTNLTQNFSCVGCSFYKIPNVTRL